MAAPTNYDQTNEWLAEVDRRVQDLINILKGGIDVGQSGTLGNLALIDTLSESPIGNLSALQQSLQVDAVAGRGVIGGAGDLLANGAYGLGGQGYMLSNFDAPPERNEFYIGAGSSATGDHGGAAYWPGIDLYRASSDRGARLMFSNEYMRFRGWEGTDTVTDFLVYHDKNILGTVSQSEGIPTGAIIERGSNANGSYVKFADGTLECTRIVNLEVQATEASDSLFRSVGVSFDFPATFVNGIAEYASASLLGSQSIQIRASGLLVKTRRGSGVLNRPDWSSTCVVATAPATSAPGELTTIALYAAGRWY
ncbi:hypothetical protein [Vreelandella venusta]|uniref:hypothetical protein n=1 Tax=Vreelandella venusta TaxID=44935 RepID=UPI0018DAAF8F|nr:hypothetical protein [Halomonas venusta]QPI66332.1 hypothetical protein IR195_01715 [Halomonas venusta]